MANSGSIDTLDHWFRKRLKRAVAVGTFAFASMAVAAYPERAISIVAPYPSGGSSDNVARALAPRLAEQLK